MMFIVSCHKFALMDCTQMDQATIAELNKEVLKSEKRRVLIIISLMVISISIIPITHSIFKSLVDNELNQKGEFASLLISIAIFFVFEVLIYMRLSYIQRKNVIMPPFVPYMNTLFELSLPVLIMVAAIKYDYSILPLEHSGYAFYIVLIILSALHLEMKVSIMAGVVAALCFSIVSFWSIDYLGMTENLAQINEIVISRIFTLIVFGLMSGLVAKEMNKKLLKGIRFQYRQKQVEILLGQQVSKEIAEELINNNDQFSTRIIDAAIMFMDIKEFSSWADSKSPEEVILYQNQVFNPIIDIINKNQGVVNQFLGDGFMASFGMGSDDQKYVQHAFQAGVDITRKMKEMEDANLIPKTFVRIGLHRGKIIVGNIGNDIRKQFSLAGKNIIIASRLEQMNKKLNTQYLVSEDIHRKIDPDNICMEEVGMLKLKGIDSEIKAYQVIC